MQNLKNKIETVLDAAVQSAIDPAIPLFVFSAVVVISAIVSAIYFYPAK